MPRVEVKIDGLRSLLGKFRGEPVYARAWRRALHRVSLAVKLEARQRAPKLSGRTAKGVYYRMDRHPVPLYSVVSDRARRKGVRYPFVLEAGHRRSKRGRDVPLHYRGTGRSTRGWFSSLQNEVQGWVNRELREAVRLIEERWEARHG